MDFDEIHQTSPVKPDPKRSHLNLAAIVHKATGAGGITMQVIPVTLLTCRANNLSRLGHSPPRVLSQALFVLLSNNSGAQPKTVDHPADSASTSARHRDCLAPTRYGTRSSHIDISLGGCRVLKHGRQPIAACNHPQMIDLPYSCLRCPARTPLLMTNKVPRPLQ